MESGLRCLLKSSSFIKGESSSCFLPAQGCSQLTHTTIACFLHVDNTLYNVGQNKGVHISKGSFAHVQKFCYFLQQLGQKV